MFIDYDKMFSTGCRDEMSRRQKGYLNYGLPKVYVIAQCKSMEIKMNDTVYNRSDGAEIVVGLDCLIMFIMAFAFIRLKWYEDISVMDMKKGKLKIEDFSVHIPSIPVSPKEYDNSPELL